MEDAHNLAQAEDDLVLPFRTVRSDVVGRVIRLGSVVDAVLSRHAYPEPVSHALGEALTLTAMLGSALKSEAQAKLILQTKTDGPLDFLVADFVAPGRLRGYASFDKADAGLAETRGRGDQGALLGKGHVAMTIDRGADKERYQGIVALDHELLDPVLSPQRLLYRLFHEEGVIVTPPASLAAACRCSRERIHTYLRQFGPAELEGMREADGGITVTCEFCSRKYRFCGSELI